MTHRKLYIIAGLSLCLNYFTAPVAGPIFYDAAKEKLADSFQEWSMALKPRAEINPVKLETLERASKPMAAAPPRMDVTKLAEAYPASQSDIIRNLLESE